MAGGKVAGCVLLGEDGFERRAWLPNLALPSSLGLILRDQLVLLAVGQLQLKIRDTSERRARAVQTPGTSGRNDFRYETW